MKPKELRDLTIEELDNKEKELRKEFFNLKFQLAAGRVESPARFTQVRRDVARVKTVLKEKEAASAKK
ncbi:MAG: 50S ribosomal protein L29 [Nitrospirota bacterium]|jgi:large subunit ribosomal protein L29|nr:50S ribosomal protein L29 [Nitrospirota bacterium]